MCSWAAAQCWQPVAIRWSRQASKSSTDLRLWRPRPAACQLHSKGAQESFNDVLLLLLLLLPPLLLLLFCCCCSC